jgi:hypothetical protein
MATYKVLSGEGLFDVAAKLYKGDTAGGIQDILSLNPDINLNASDLFGMTLTYTLNLNRAKEKFLPIVRTTPIASYKTVEKQTVYDLAIQLYGDLSRIGAILETFQALNNEIPVSSVVPLGEQIDPIALFFNDPQRQIKVATDTGAEDGPEGSARLLEDGSYRLLETGDFRLLE